MQRLLRVIIAVAVGVMLSALVTGFGLAAAGRQPPVDPLGEVEEQAGDLPGPLLAWSVAADGAVYVLDGEARLARLAPVSLTVETRSEPLFSPPITGSYYLLVGDSRLFVGSQAVTQTLVLDRRSFEPLATLDQAGPLALDPERRLFLAPAVVRFRPGSFDASLPVYDLADLSRPPTELVFSCEAPELAVTRPADRRLYLRTRSLCSSPPHVRQRHLLYNLDTLTQTGLIPAEALYGRASRLSLARDSDHMVLAYSGLLNTTLLLFDGQGQELFRGSNWYGSQQAQALIDPAGAWIYWRFDHSLWVLRREDFMVTQVRPLSSPVTDMALSPDGETLYLFAPAGIEVIDLAGELNP